MGRARDGATGVGAAGIEGGVERGGADGGGGTPADSCGGGWGSGSGLAAGAIGGSPTGRLRGGVTELGAVNIEGGVERGGADCGGGPDTVSAAIGFAPSRDSWQLPHIVTMSDLGFSAPQ